MGAATRRASLRSLILVVMRRVGCGRDAPQLGRIDEAVRGGGGRTDGLWLVLTVRCS